MGAVCDIIEMGKLGAGDGSLIIITNSKWFHIIFMLYADTRHVLTYGYIYIYLLLVAR